MQICGEINFPLALDKTEWANTSTTFLGILVDGQRHALVVPEEKRLKALNMIRQICQKKKSTVRQLQSLAGTLNFINKAIHPRRAFTRRMYAKFSFASVFKKPVNKHVEPSENYNKQILNPENETIKLILKPHHHVNLDGEFRFDCRVWELFLQSPQNFCRPLVDFEEGNGADTINLYTDALLAEDKGFGCIFNNYWTHGSWPKSFIANKKPNIEFAELYALCIAIFAWEELLQNRKIRIFCDNTAVMNMVYHNTSGCKNCMYLVRLLTLHNLKWNRRVYMTYMKSKDNVFADSLSRIQLGAFWYHVKKKGITVNSQPSPLPARIYPIDRLWEEIENFHNNTHQNHLTWIIPITFFATKKSKRRKETSDTTSTTDSISTKEILNIVEKLKVQRNRLSTRQNYYGIWKIFNHFFIRLDHKPDNWEDRLTLFVGYLVENKKKSSTVHSYISAIKSVLKDDGIELSEDKFLLSALTSACKYKNDKVTTRLPIRESLLKMILQETKQHFDELGQIFLSRMYRYLFLTAYYGLFRVGELTSGDHPVLARDVHVADNKNKMLFLLRTSKTHWTDAKPQLIKISNNSHVNIGESFCPYNSIRKYLIHRGGFAENREPFFIFGDGSPVKPEHFQNTLRQMIEKCGLISSVYGCHSLRAGRTMDLFYKYHLSIETIKKIGRWRSNTIYTYLS